MGLGGRQHHSTVRDQDPSTTLIELAAQLQLIAGQMKTTAELLREEMRADAERGVDPGPDRP